MYVYVPASIFKTEYRIDTPVRSSPFSKHLCTGAAPLYLGSKLGWIFTVPNFGIDKNLPKIPIIEDIITIIASLVEKYFSVSYVRSSNIIDIVGAGIVIN